MDGEEAPIYMGVRPEGTEAYTKYIAALISSGFFLARLFDGARKNVRLAAYWTFLENRDARIERKRLGYSSQGHKSGNKCRPLPMSEMTPHAIRRQL